MTHAAESTHFYKRDGSPCYTVKAKAGHERPTNVADARKLSLVPSVTTVIKCASAPGLTNWMIDQAILAALTLPVVAGESSDEYLARIKRDSKEQARKAAERGTTIHAAIQGYYEAALKGLAFDTEYGAYINSAYDQLQDWLPQAQTWKPEASFSSPMGFGGKVDLHWSQAVVDFKTKEFGEDSDLKTWDEHAMQLAAYRVGLGIGNARCAICYVSVTNPGLSRLIEIPEDELKKGWAMFQALLVYWMAKNKYNSSFDREQKAA